MQEKQTPLFLFTFIILFIAILFASSSLPAAQAAPAVIVPNGNNGDGPGGVGITDGSSPLELWLDGNASAFTDTVCTVPASIGGSVACWQDKSGNSQNFTQSSSANRPNLQTSINSQPVVRFNDSTKDWLQLSGLTSLTGISGYTIFIIGSASGGSQDFLAGTRGSNEYGLLVESSGTNQLRFLHRMPFGSVGGDSLTTIGGHFTFGTTHLISLLRNSTNIEMYIQGGNREFASTTTGAYTENLNLVLGRLGVADTRYLNGDIGQVIIFSNALNSTERILVENHLSAKYGTALIANDVYDGDTIGNGNFDLNVAGIGQFGGNQHTQSHAAGMIVVNNSFLNADGDWLLFGHKTAVNNNNPNDLPASTGWGGSNAQRWERHYYIDVTDVGTTGGTVDIIFDFSEGGMNKNGAMPAGSVSNYRLLKRTLDTGAFTDVATATAIVGDQVQFIGVDVNLLGSNFTLGTLDASSSPTAVSLQSLTKTTTTTRPLLIATLLLALMGGVALRRRAG